MINSTSESMLISALIKFPELVSGLKISSQQVSDVYAKRLLQYVERENKLDIADVWRLSQKHGTDFIPPDIIKQARQDKMIFKSHFIQYQIDVLEEFKTRKLIEATELYRQQPTKDNRQTLNETISYLNELHIQKRNSKKDVIDKIIKTMNHEIAPTLIKTNYKQLDNLIGGFEAGQLVIVGARPSLGKTAFALNLALKMEEAGSNVTVFSLETTEEKITQRILSTMTGIKLSKFKTPDAIADIDRLKILEAIEVYSKKHITIDDNERATPTAIRNYIAGMDPDKKNVIIIDYLQLMNSESRFRDRRLELEDISRKLKIMSKQFNCVIIALSQLSRGVESRNEKRPMMSDLREAGGIEQDADMIFLLYRDDYYNKPTEYDPSSKSEIECIIAKNKDGATGTALFDFYKAVQRFY